MNMSRVKYRKVQKVAPILVAARSEAWVCGHSPAGIVGLNPAGAMAVSCKCCLLSGRVICDELFQRSPMVCGVGVCVCVCG